MKFHMKLSFCVPVFKLIATERYLRLLLSHPVSTLIVHLVKGTRILKYSQDPQKWSILKLLITVERHQTA